MSPLKSTLGVIHRPSPAISELSTGYPHHISATAAVCIHRTGLWRDQGVDNRPEFRSLPKRAKARLRALRPFASQNQAFAPASALPRIRLTVVPQTGHGPLAILMLVLEMVTVPSNSRFSLHFTQ